MLPMTMKVFGRPFDTHFDYFCKMFAHDVNNLATKLQDGYFAQFTKAITAIIIPSIRRNFQVGGRPAWEPLAKSTVVSRHGSPTPILRRTDRLMNAATDPHMWNIGQWEAAFNGFKFDNKVPYAKYHQGGTNPMPARPFLAIQLEDELAIQRIFIEYVEEQTQRFWGNRPDYRGM